MRVNTVVPTCGSLDTSGFMMCAGPESLGGAASPFHIDAGQDSEAHQEVRARGEDGKAVVAAREPGDGAIGDWAKNGGHFHGQAPEAEELRAAVRRAQIAHQRAARGL